MFKIGWDQAQDFNVLFTMMIRLQLHVVGVTIEEILTIAIVLQ